MNIVGLTGRRTPHAAAEVRSPEGLLPQRQDSSAHALTRACLIAARSGSGRVPSRRSNRTRGNAPTPCTFATDSRSRKGRWPRGTSKELPRDCRVIGMWMISVLGASRSSANNTTTGRVLAARPKSASQTSPWRGCMTIKDVEHFLFDLAPRQHVSPLLLLSLLLQEPEVVPQFPQHLFRLVPNRFNQAFLRDHGGSVTSGRRADKDSARSLSKAVTPSRSVRCRSVQELPVSSSR